MERKETGDGKLQGNSLEEVREGLKTAARRIRKAVKRDGRQLEEGPVLSRLVAWFLIQEPEIQNRIVAQGHRIIEDLKVVDKPVSDLDKHAEELRERYRGALVRFISDGSVFAGDGKLSEKRPRVVGLGGVVKKVGPKAKGKHKPAD